MAGGRLGEYEGVDEGEMEGLHSLLHTVGFFFYFPFLVLSVLVTKPTDSTRERERERERQRETGRHRERGRGRESARACVRAAFGALGICARRNTVRAQGGWGERVYWPLLSADGCARALTHKHSAHPRTDDTRGSSLAHRLTDVALALHAIGCDSCPRPRKPILCQYLVP